MHLFFKKKRNSAWESKDMFLAYDKYINYFRSVCLADFASLDFGLQGPGFESH